MYPRGRKFFESRKNGNFILCRHITRGRNLRVVIHALANNNIFLFAITCEREKTRTARMYKLRLFLLHRLLLFIARASFM